MIGLLAGSFVFGYLGDMIGRRWALFIAIWVTVIAGFGGAFVDNYWWYCVTRFFTGAGRLALETLGIRQTTSKCFLGAQGCMVLPFVLAVELAGKETRTLVGINVQVAFALGESVVSVIGIRVKDWKDFQVNITF